MALSKLQLYYGKNEAPPKATPLRAGKISLVYERGELRYFQAGGVEFLRGIYSAVRDQVWTTIPVKHSDVQMDIQPDSFRITFIADHVQDEVNFRWKGTITGTSDSVVTFDMEGEALTSFKRNRIGFCILHPSTCSGHPVTIEEVDGKRVESAFPTEVVPRQPFFNIRAIRHEVVPNVIAEVRGEGDTFEMEDQRNWSDASFKTYCTPVGLPLPVQLTPGSKVHQTVTVSLIGETSPLQVESPASSTDQPITLTIGTETGQVPKIGLGGYGLPLTDQMRANLTSAGFSHLRAGLRGSHLEQDLVVFRRIASDAKALGLSLEVGLHLTDDPARVLNQLNEVLTEISPQVAWVTLYNGFDIPTAEQLALAAQILPASRLGAGLIAGSAVHFTNLNQNPPDTTHIKGVSYAVNPQVHAFDNGTMIENVGGQRLQAESARKLMTSTVQNPLAAPLIIVSPVTLQWFINANEGYDQADSAEMPSMADARQNSLFGAAWTVSSIKSITEGHADGATYFTVAGWFGVMNAEGLYPAFHVLAEVSRHTGKKWIASRSSDSWKVDGLVIQDNGQTTILLANLTDTDQSVMVNGAVQGSQATIKRLDETTSESVQQNPHAMQGHSAGEDNEAISISNNTFSVQLRPFGLAFIRL